MSTAQRAQRARRIEVAAPSIAAPVLAQPVPAAPEPANDATEGPARPVRKPFGGRRQRLDNTPIPGFQCYWFNDLPGRVEQAREAGYEHITDHEGKPVKKVVGVMEGGGPLVAYRMKIPREWFEEDQAAKEVPRAEIDAQMRQGGKDSGYASPGRPGYTDSKVAADMTADGRQTFGTKSQTPG